MDPLRANFLKNTLAYILNSGFRVSELVLFILDQYHDPSLPALQDLIVNATSIASAFNYHPAISPSICTWAHELMCARYSNAVQALSKAEHGWHFGAMHTAPEQIRDFQIESMASTMETTSPELWTLIRALLGAVDLKKVSRSGAGPVSETSSTPSSSAGGAELDSDSDGEYWELVEEAGLAEGMESAASGGKENQARNSEKPKQGSQKKRRRRALQGTFLRIVSNPRPS